MNLNSIKTLNLEVSKHILAKSRHGMSLMASKMGTLTTTYPFQFHAQTLCPYKVDPNRYMGIHFENQPTFYQSTMKVLSTDSLSQLTCGMGMEAKAHPFWLEVETMKLSKYTKLRGGGFFGMNCTIYKELLDIQCLNSQLRWLCWWWHSHFGCQARHWSLLTKLSSQL